MSAPSKDMSFRLVEYDSDVESDQDIVCLENNRDKTGFVEDKLNISHDCRSLEKSPISTAGVVSVKKEFDYCEGVAVANTALSKVAKSMTDELVQPNDNTNDYLKQQIDPGNNEPITGCKANKIKYTDLHACKVNDEAELKLCEFDCIDVNTKNIYKAPAAAAHTRTDFSMDAGVISPKGGTDNKSEVALTNQITTSSMRDHSDKTVSLSHALAMDSCDIKTEPAVKICQSTELAQPLSADNVVVLAEQANLNNDRAPDINVDVSHSGERLCLSRVAQPSAVNANTPEVLSSEKALPNVDAHAADDVSSGPHVAHKADQLEAQDCQTEENCQSGEQGCQIEKQDSHTGAQVGQGEEQHGSSVVSMQSVNAGAVCESTGNDVNHSAPTENVVGMKVEPNDETVNGKNMSDVTNTKDPTISNGHLCHVEISSAGSGEMEWNSALAAHNDQVDIVDVDHRGHEMLSSSSSSDESSASSDVTNNTNVVGSKLLVMDDDFDDDLDDDAAKEKPRVVRTKGEFTVEDLPPIDELTITVEESVTMTHVGHVSSVISVLVVVKANADTSPLNIDSVLFLKDRKPLGRVFETIGPVKMPSYTVRFNTVEDITAANVSVGDDVFYAPEEQQFTNYVFVQQLQQQKGSDASWEHNNEPPAKFLEFSDDEEEQRAKAKNRNKSKDNNKQDGDDSSEMYEKRSRGGRGGKRGQHHQRDGGAQSQPQHFTRSQDMCWPPRNPNASQGGFQRYRPPPRPKMLPDNYEAPFSYSSGQSVRPRPPRFSRPPPPMFAPPPPHNFGPGMTPHFYQPPPTHFAPCGCSHAAPAPPPPCAHTASQQWEPAPEHNPFMPPAGYLMRPYMPPPQHCSHAQGHCGCAGSYRPAAGPPVHSHPQQHCRNPAPVTSRPGPPHVRPQHFHNRAPAPGSAAPPPPGFVDARLMQSNQDR